MFNVFPLIASHHLVDSSDIVSAMYVLCKEFEGGKSHRYMPITMRKI